MNHNQTLRLVFWELTASCNLKCQHCRAEAQALFERLLPVLAFSNQHLDISIHFFKRLLHAQGIYRTPRVREPILRFDHVHERRAAELIEYVIALEDETAALQRGKTTPIVGASPKEKDESHAAP